MHGDGVTEFPAGTDRGVHHLLPLGRGPGCRAGQGRGRRVAVHQPSGRHDLSRRRVRDAHVHAAERHPPVGSPYYTSAFWPEGPFVAFRGASSGSSGCSWRSTRTSTTANGPGRDHGARPGGQPRPARLETIVVHVTSTSDPDGHRPGSAEDAPSSRSSVAELRCDSPRWRPIRPRGLIKVTDGDTVTVSYCPRDCETPYVDTATWYQLVATITPTRCRRGRTVAYGDGHGTARDPGGERHAAARARRTWATCRRSAPIEASPTTWATRRSTPVCGRTAATCTTAWCSSTSSAVSRGRSRHRSPPGAGRATTGLHRAREWSVKLLDAGDRLVWRRRRSTGVHGASSWPRSAPSMDDRPRVGTYQQLRIRAGSARPDRRAPR